MSAYPSVPSFMDSPVTTNTEEGVGRQRRRQEEHSRRRHRRALARDIDREGIGEIADQCQEPSVSEVLRLCDGDDGRPLSASDLRRVGRGLAGSAAARAAFAGRGDWRPRLRRLVDALTGKDPDCQLEAAVCVTNLAVGPASPELAGTVGGYLVTLSASGSHHLQEQCVWALGNLAGSGAAVCAVLAAQGLPSAGLSCLGSAHHSVRESAAAALAAFLTLADGEHALRLSTDLLPLLTPLLSLDSPGVCFCLSAAVASPVSDHLLSTAPPDLLPTVTDLLLRAAVTPEPSLTELRCLTHLLRALTHLVLTPGAAAALLRQPSALRLLTSLLRCRLRHVRRETLLLVANVTAGERGEEARGVVEEVGLKGRLAALLEDVYSTL